MVCLFLLRPDFSPRLPMRFDAREQPPPIFVFEPFELLRDGLVSFPIATSDFFSQAFEIAAIGFDGYAIGQSTGFEFGSEILSPLFKQFVGPVPEPLHYASNGAGCCDVESRRFSRLPERFDPTGQLEEALRRVFWDPAAAIGHCDDSEGFDGFGFGNGPKQHDLQPARLATLPFDVRELRETTHGLAPLPRIYPSPVNTTPTAPSFGVVYARYLRQRADGFDADQSISDAEMEEVIGAETRALIDVATTPVETVEDYALKLGLLQSELEAHDAGASAIMLAASLVSDLRNI